MWRRTATRLAMTLALGAALVSPAALAQGRAKTPAASVSSLEAECARLRAELERANAAVAALKRADRGVRDDYRLRERMADAEALARKLTAAEARLRGARGGSPPPATLPAPSPASSPADGPVELEAKADLLADEARKLTAQADALARTATQTRARQTLRRRAAGLERDPFIGIESSKRNMVVNVQRGAASPQEEKAVTPPPPPAPTDNSRTIAPTNSPGSAAPSGGPAAATAPPPSAGQDSTAQPGSGTASTGTPTGLSQPGGPAPQPTTALGVQIRALIDPATAAEIQRLQASGRPGADVEALEKAAAALRQRAQALEAESRKLRSASGRK